MRKFSRIVRTRSNIVARETYYRNSDQSNGSDPWEFMRLEIDNKLLHRKDFCTLLVATSSPSYNCSASALTTSPLCLRAIRTARSLLPAPVQPRINTIRPFHSDIPSLCSDRLPSDIFKCHWVFEEGINLSVVLECCSRCSYNCASIFFQPSNDSLNNWAQDAFSKNPARSSN